MPTAPMQVVVIPYRKGADGEPEFAIFQRIDDGKWQPIAGGAEDEESAAMAARREAFEEAGIPASAPMLRLQTMDTVPVTLFSGRDSWPAELYVVPQYCFAIDVTGLPLTISAEHTRFEWLAYEQASERLSYDSNRTALWELHERLGSGDLPVIPE